MPWGSRRPQPRRRRDRARLVDAAPSLARPALRRPSWPPSPGAVASAVPTGATRDHLVAGVVNVCLPAVDSEALLYVLEHEHAVLASAASSCASGAQEPSHVLAALGIEREPGRRLAPAVPRAGRTTDEDITAAERGRAHGRSAVCRTTHATEPRRDRARARRDVGWRRLVGRRRAAGGGGPRGRRCHAEALGRAVRLGLLLGGRRRRRSCRRPRGSASSTTSSTSATTSTSTSSRPTSPTTRPAARPTRASSATATSSSTACSGGRTPSGSTRSPPGHHARIVELRRRHRDASRAGPTPPRTSPTSCTSSRSTPSRRVRFPVGHLPRHDVRAEAARLGLPTADKPDSQDVCFITATGGRLDVPRRPHRRPARARSSTATGATVGAVAAVELVTLGPAPRPRSAGRHRRRATWSTSTSPTATVTVGSAGRPAASTGSTLADLVWVGARRARSAAGPGERARHRRGRAASRATPSCSTRPPAGSRPARASCSTTATSSSAAASRPGRPHAHPTGSRRAAASPEDGPGPGRA